MLCTSRAGYGARVLGRRNDIHSYMRKRVPRQEGTYLGSKRTEHSKGVPSKQELSLPESSFRAAYALRSTWLGFCAWPRLFSGRRPSIEYAFGGLMSRILPFFSGFSRWRKYLEQPGSALADRSRHSPRSTGSGPADSLLVIHEGTSLTVLAPQNNSQSKQCSSSCGPTPLV